jgi:hypothetical protein
MRLLMIPLGLLALLAGALLFWLPIPLGIPLILLGLLILVRHSMPARRSLLRMAKRHPRLRKALRLLRRRAGADYR